MTLYEATQNPHFEKIRKAVIMNRRPEAESFDEALIKEAKEVSCAYYDVTTFPLNFTEDVYGIIKILGRPIILEDILILTQQHSTHLITRMEYDICILKIFEIEDDVRDKLKCKIEWQLTKSLHVQTPETWEKIAELI